MPHLLDSTKLLFALTCVLPWQAQKQESADELHKQHSQRLCGEQQMQEELKPERTPECKQPDQHMACSISGPEEVQRRQATDDNTTKPDPAPVSGSVVAPEPLSPGPVNDAGLSECVVCWAAVVSIVFLPCGHTCTCSDCAAVFLASAVPCPMCRQAVTSTVAVAA